MVCSFVYTRAFVHDKIKINSWGIYIENSQRRLSYKWASIVDIKLKGNIGTVDENVESWTVEGKMLHFDVKQFLRLTLMKETVYVDVTKYWFVMPLMLGLLHKMKLKTMIDSESYKEYARFCIRLLVILLGEILMGMLAVL